MHFFPIIKSLDSILYRLTFVLYIHMYIAFSFTIFWISQAHIKYSRTPNHDPKSRFKGNVYFFFTYRGF